VDPKEVPAVVSHEIAVPWGTAIDQLAVQPALLQEVFEQRRQLFEISLRHAIAITQPEDWVIYGDPNGKHSVWLEGDGAERIAMLLAIDDVPGSLSIDLEDEDNESRTYHATITVQARGFGVQQHGYGAANNREKFWRRDIRDRQGNVIRTEWAQSRVLRKAAITRARGNAIVGLLGLRGLTRQWLHEHGMAAEKINQIPVSGFQAGKYGGKGSPQSKVKRMIDEQFADGEKRAAQYRATTAPRQPSPEAQPQGPPPARVRLAQNLRAIYQIRGRDDADMAMLRRAVAAATNAEHELIREIPEEMAAKINEAMETELHPECTMEQFEQWCQKHYAQEGGKA